jgi:hypothetical protein
MLLVNELLLLWLFFDFEIIQVFPIHQGVWAVHFIQVVSVSALQPVFNGVPPGFFCIGDGSTQEQGVEMPGRWEIDGGIGEICQ